MELPQIKKLLLSDKRFLEYLGMFHAAWASADMTVDFAIGKFMNTSVEQTHLLTSGMEFGRKARLLDGLIKGSLHKNKSTLLGSLRKMRNDSLRNAFAHSYMSSNATTVTFIERSSGSNYSVTNHTFTLPKFTYHVQTVIEAGKDFWVALEASDQELSDFAQVAFKAASS